MPEQHCTFSTQTPHCSVHPPAAPHRLTPSGPMAHTLVQQSSAPMHGSPTCLLHGMPSLVLHDARGAQRPVFSALAVLASVTAVHRPEQQSESSPQISPPTRHPSRSAQRIATHFAPQQSGLCMQPSPAGLHMGEAGGGGGGPGGGMAAAGSAQEPDSQSLLQQSMFSVQWAPSTPQVGPATHRGAPPSSAPAQASVQHSPAKEHGTPVGRHPAPGGDDASPGESAAAASR
jgi:hypothetical protein